MQLQVYHFQIFLSQKQFLIFMKTFKAILLLSFIILQTGTQALSFRSIDGDSTKIEYAEKVKQEFLHSWNAYKKYAWGKDQLKPLSKTFRNWYDESLLMTPVDAFDTMILMGLKEEAKETKELIFKNLSFDKNFFVQNFEITIRLLGGLISAYQLDGDKRFLNLAEDLGNRLLPAFKSKTGMPYVNVNLKTGEVKNPVNNPAEIGTSNVRVWNAQ